MKTMFWKSIYYLLLILIFTLFILFLILVLLEYNINFILTIFSVFFALLILSNNYFPLIMGMAGKLKEIKDGPIFEIVQDVFNNLNLSNKISVYIRPFKQNKTMNASVQGFSSCSLIINECLIGMLESEELKAVIYHECYHIIKKHDLKRTLNSILFSLLPIISIAIVYYLNATGSMAISLLMIFVFIAYGLIMLRIFRVQEINADIFSSKQIMDKKYLVSALTKLTNYNRQKTNTFKLRKIISSHPYLDDRINYILSQL